MKKITIHMINIWKMTNTDWFGYKICKDNLFSYHHIEKRENEGPTTINNGAILCAKTSHPYLHLIEDKDLELYIYLSNILKNINNQREMPNRQQLLAIDSILSQFEREWQGKTNKRGKQLIKEEYTRRFIK